MITIYSDFHRIQQVKQTKTAIVANKIQDYVFLRQWLRHALDEVDEDYEVYIQHRVLQQWLRDLRAYSPHLISWKEIYLDSYFEQRFGFPPPKELGEAAQRDLIKTMQPMHHSETITDPIGLILNNQINPVWDRLQPDKQHLIHLAASLLNGKNIPSMLLLLAKKRITQWADQDNRYQVFLDATAPKEAAEKIFLRWALQTYPSKAIVHQDLSTVPLEDCSQYTDICIEKLKKYNSQIKSYWFSLLATNSEPDITKILDSMSGLADAELEVIDRLTRKHIEQLSKTLLANIKTRFSHLQQTKGIIEKLEKIIPPPLPDEPAPTWSAVEWVDWVTDDYIPYFAWVLRNKQPRNRQMQLAYRFEEWLIDNYPQLPQDPQAPFSPHQLDKIKESLKSDTADVVFWFIVDGLTWWQGKKLADLCAERDIKGVQVQPTISVLPTITSISKSALLKGYLDSSDTNRQTIQVLKTRLEKEIKNIQIFTQFNELEQAYLNDLTPGLYALLYNSLDHHCHTIQGFTDDESIDGYLRLITRLIKEGFDRCSEQGLRPRAFVSSDHGSTLLPEKAAVLKIPQFAYMPEDDENLEGNTTEDKTKPFKRTRVCATNNIPSKDDLNSLTPDWHYLQKDAFNLPKQFFIPKGYSAVERRPVGWTHGGATPEEVVVPNLELQPSLDEFIAPILRIEGYLRPGKTTMLKTIVGNPNRFPLKIIQLSIESISTPTKRMKVGPNSTLPIEVEGQATSTQSNQRVKWLLMCEGGGQHKTFEGSADIPIRRLQVSNIDDMFEGL